MVALRRRFDSIATNSRCTTAGADFVLRDSPAARKSLAGRPRQPGCERDAMPAHRRRQAGGIPHSRFAVIGLGVS
jgi:hypothetical protein